MRIVRTRRGARLVESDAILSEIRSSPGPTDSLFDVLAACVAALAPGPRVALLGFAGGGLVAPLRGMGFPHPLDAVDLSRAGEKIFRELSATWAGEIRLAQADAERWLRRSRRRFDLILEDLSTTGNSGTIKPYTSFDSLPRTIRARLGRSGLAVTNLLPLPGSSNESLAFRVAQPYRCALVVYPSEYLNRIVIAGDILPSARKASRRIRGFLSAIRSNQEKTVSVRTLFRS